MTDEHVMEAIVNNDQNNKHSKMGSDTTIKLQASTCQPLSVVLERLSPEVYQSKSKKGIQKKQEEQEERNNTEKVLPFDRYRLRSRKNKRMTRKKRYERINTITKEVSQNMRHIDSWKYKRKYNASSCKESDNTSDVSMEQSKKRKITKSKSEYSNNTFIIEDLFYFAVCTNITDAKVVLIRLEDIHDNEYITNWKKKLTEKDFLNKSVEHSEQYRNLSTSTSSMDIMGTSQEDIIEINENNTSAERSLSSYDLKSRHKRSKNPKVLLVKLESLKASFEEQKLASKIEQLTANYNRIFGLNSITYSNNIISNSSESNINQCMNETSVNMSSIAEKNDTVNEHSVSDTLVIMSSPRKENDIGNQHATNETSINLSSVGEENDIVNKHSTSDKSVTMSSVRGENDIANLCATNETSVNLSSVGKENNIVNEHSTSDTSATMSSVREESDIANQHATKETSVHVTSVGKESNIVNEHSTSETSVDMSSIEEKNDVVNQHSRNDTLVSMSSPREVNDIANQQATNKTSVNLSSVGQESDIVNQHFRNEPTMTSSLSNSVLQDACNSKELPLKSVSTKNHKSTENVENVGIFEQSIFRTDENAILSKPAENLQGIGLLAKTSINNETRIIESSNNGITNEDVSNTSLERNLTAEAQKINALDSINSDITSISEDIEKSINDSFVYTCIACNSSFKDFRTLPSHLKKCLAISKERKNSHDNNVKCNVSNNTPKIAGTLKCSNIPKSKLHQVPATIDNENKLSALKKKLSKERWKNLKLVNKQLQNKTNVQCSVCSEVFDTMVSLSDHIYSHTEVELQRAYEIAKMKQASTKHSGKNNSKNDVATADLDKKSQNVLATTGSSKKSQSTVATTGSSKKSQSTVGTTGSSKKSQSTVATSGSSKKSQSAVAPTSSSNKKSKSTVATTGSSKKSQSIVATTDSSKKSQNTVATTGSSKKSQSTVATTSSSTNIQSIVATTGSSKKSQSTVTTTSSSTNIQSIVATTSLSTNTQSTVTTTSSSTKIQSAVATTGLNKKTQNDVATTEHKKAKVPLIPIKPKTTQVNEVSNTSSPLTSKSQKQLSKLLTVDCVSPVTCDCHKPVTSDERCIELVLHCSVCKVIFRTKECFDAHLEKAKPFLCKSKQLIGTIQKLYCSACKIILYSFVDMRRHTENHIKNQQQIKLFCHICKVRFIGVGPIFNLHWFNHMKNLHYIASVSNFPKASLVDSNSTIWSLFTSDNYNYLIVTEHVCNFCNEQFFSTNQLQKHVSTCSKRKDIELSRAIPENNDNKEHNINSELNLRLFCTLCKVMFKEKSLFETHAVGHKQHLQPQYFCFSMADIKRMYICNVCASAYNDLKEFKTHWQDHNAIRETFMCYKCKNNFPTLETFVDHSKQCDISRIPLNEPSCQVTYYETIHSCKICNIGFESYRALYQHSSIHNIKFSRLSVVCPKEVQDTHLAQNVSSLSPNTVQSDKEQLSTTSSDSTAKITMIDTKKAEEKDTTLEILKDVTDTCTQSKSSTESKTVESVGSEIDHTSLNDNLSLTDADTEVLSECSDVEMDDLNKMVQESCPDECDKSNDAINKNKENETSLIDNVHQHNKTPVIDVQSKEKTETSEVNMEDDVILIEPTTTNEETEKLKNKSSEKVPEKNKDIPKEATNDPKSNDVSKSNEKPVEVPKYLRVKNISELMDHKVKYTCPTCGISCDTKMSLDSHSTLHNQEALTSKKSLSIFSRKFLCGGDLKQQNINMLANQDPLNLQQERGAVVPEVPIEQPTFIPYSISQVTQQDILSCSQSSCQLMPPPPPYTTASTMPTQDFNIQNSSLSNRSVIHNAKNTGINTNGIQVPSTSAQPQNFYLNNQVSFELPLSNVTNSSNNFINNNQPIQTSNGASRIVQPNPPVVSTSNAIPNLSYTVIQPQDTHSRIKLQNAIHQKCSDKTSNVTPVNILPKPVQTCTLTYNQNTCLPISSANQYYSTQNFSGIYPSTSVANPQQNNPMTTVNTTNTGQMSTFYQPSSESSNVAPPLAPRHTIHHKPSPSAVYMCYRCTQPTYFTTIQQLDEHLSIHHTYTCDICNERMFSLEDLILHRLKHNSTFTQNTF